MFISQREAAVMLGVSPLTVKDWRLRPGKTNSGPPHVRIGGRVKYSLDDLHDYIAARRVAV